jgi:hypothetical protein
MPSRILATIILGTMLCLATSAYLHAQQTTITPPSNLPANTPAGYNLIVPVVGQQESEWCWAASNKMVFEYDSPLPPVLQCEEANGATGRSDCCTNPGSASCNQGDSDAGGKYPFAYFGAPSGMPLTWDQLRYQILVINKPLTFGWNWVRGLSHPLILDRVTKESGAT